MSTYPSLTELRNQLPKNYMREILDAATSVIQDPHDTNAQELLRERVPPTMIVHLLAEIAQCHNAHARLR